MTIGLLEIEKEFFGEMVASNRPFFKGGFNRKRYLAARKKYEKSLMEYYKNIFSEVREYPFLYSEVKLRPGQAIEVR